MITVPFDIDQTGWGSSRVYADNPDFAPRYFVQHWGGLTSQVAADGEAAKLRGWQRYHINSKGWSDIAYNYGVGDSGKVYRLRGLNRGGHVKCSVDHTPEGDSYCDASIGVVWIGGRRDSNGPSPAAKLAVQNMIEVTGLEVKGHREVKQENGSYTSCPGDDWLGWIESFRDDDIMKIGDTGKDVAKLQDFLNRFEIEYGSASQYILVDGVYGPDTEAEVNVFQGWASLDIGNASTMTQATLAALLVPNVGVPNG